jgi:CBS domain-containing protein
MKVKEIMTANAKACTPTDTLPAAARFMWDNDCKRS